VFRGGATFVNVDVYPRRDGRIVEGLRTEDFQVFEDGKPQKIEAFEFIRQERASADGERRDPNSKEDGDRQAADPHNRVFVVYLDVYHTSRAGSRDMQRPLLNFLQGDLGPSDLFAVTTPEESTADLVFARRTDTIETELAKHPLWGLSDQPISPLDRPAIEAQLATCMTASAPSLGDALVALNREDMLTTHLRELMERLRDLRDGRTNVLFVSEGWTPRPPAEELTTLASGKLPTVGVGRDGRLRAGARDDATRDGAWCDQQMVRLSAIDFEQRFRDVLALASQANVSFYPVDPGGLTTGAAAAAGRGRGLVQTPQEQIAARLVSRRMGGGITALRELAENTGGRAIVQTNDLSAGFRQIAGDVSAYYLLGYSSTNTDVDGKYRRIEVKIAQPRVSVVARRGYVARRTITVPAATTSPASSSDPSAVATELERLAALRPDAALYSYGARSVAGLDVVAELAARELTRGQWTGGVDVQVTVTRGNGEIATGAGRIEPGARGGVVHVPLPATDEGPWHVAVRASNQASVADDRSEVPAATTAGPIDDPVLFRALPSARSVPRPVADLQFRRTERLHVEWPVAATAKVRGVRLLDRRGQPLPIAPAVAERPADGIATRSVVTIELMLAPLAAGDYLVELSVEGTAGEERRLVAFRIIQ
jgi:VWFA-related protein